MRKCLSALILAKPRYNCKGILKTHKLYILYNVLVSCELHFYNFFFILLSVYIQVVPGGMCQTSGGCSLC